MKYIKCHKCNDNGNNVNVCKCDEGEQFHSDDGLLPEMLGLLKSIKERSEYLLLESLRTKSKFDSGMESGMSEAYCRMNEILDKWR